MKVYITQMNTLNEYKKILKSSSNLNILTTMLLQGINIVINLILLNKFLERFGSEINGSLSIISQIMIYLKLVEAGIAMSVINALYNPIVKKERNTINAILVASKEQMKKSGVVFSLLVLIAGLIYATFAKDIIGFKNMYIIFIVMALPIVIDFFLLGYLKQFLIASKKSYIINVFSIIAICLSALLRYFAIELNYSLITIQILHSSTSIILFLLLKIYSKNKYSWIDLSVSAKSDALGKRNAGMIHQLTGLVVNSSSIILVSIYLGFKEASVYALYLLIFSTTSGLLWSVSSSLTPYFGHKINENQNINYIFNRFENYYYSICVIVVFALLVFSQSFINFFTLNVTDIDYNDVNLTILFSFVALLNILRIPVNLLIVASGSFDKVVREAMIEMFINISSKVILFFIFGLYGILIGEAISFSYRLIASTLFASKKVLNDKSLVRFFKLSIAISIIIISSFLII